MNERIEKLANQAGAIKYEVDFQRNSYPVNLEELQKFAELIVKECASIVYKTDTDHADGLALLLLEHFGVEK